MRLDYDLNVGALYIALTGAPVASTREAGDNANVDLDATGNVVGIEVISAAHRWPLSEILDSYPISTSDKAQLKAYFMPVAGSSTGPQQPLPPPVPEFKAEPTAPSVLAAA